MPVFVSSVQQRGAITSGHCAIFEVGVMCAYAYHASMKMQRAEGPKASIEIRRKALGPQSGSEKVILEVVVGDAQLSPQTLCVGEMLRTTLYV